MRWIVGAPIAVSVLLSVTAPAQIAWYNSSRQYRKKPNIIAWVKFASIWDTDDTQICLHCGNSCATSQQNVRAV